MLLANTTTNGYSLGLPLWKSGDAGDLSTGYVQGISITCYTGTYANADVKLAKYVCEDGSLSLVFQLDGEPLCSLETPVPSRSVTLELQSESENFCQGFVTLAPTNTVFKNLTNAVVNPKYIHFIPRSASGSGNIRVVTSSGTTASVLLTRLSVDSSYTVNANVSGGTVTFDPVSNTETVAQRDIEHFY